MLWSNHSKYLINLNPYPIGVISVDHCYTQHTNRVALPLPNLRRRKFVFDLQLNLPQTEIELRHVEITPDSPLT